MARTATKRKAAGSDETYRAALRATLETYSQRPAEIFVWVLGSGRYATANAPTDPKAEILYHETLS